MRVCKDCHEGQEQGGRLKKWYLHTKRDFCRCDICKEDTIKECALCNCVNIN